MTSFVPFSGELDAPQGKFVPFAGELDAPDAGYDARGPSSPEEVAPPPEGPSGKVAQELGSLRDALFSGVDQAVASVKNVNAAGSVSRLQGLQNDLADLERRGRGDSNDARLIRGEIETQSKRVPRSIASAASSQRQADLGSQMATKPSVQKVAQAKTFEEAWGAFKEAPYEIIAGVTAQSLPQMVPALITGALVGPGTGAAAMGLSSGAMEFGNSLADYARDSGVEPGDAKAMEAFYSDPKQLSAALKYAGTRAGIIGTLDAASGHMAGKVLAPPLKNAVAREAVNMPVQMAVQAGAGAAGEGGAQLATKGEVTQPGQVLLEAAGELGTAPVEVAAFGRHAAKQAAAPSGNPTPSAEEIARSKGFLQPANATPAILSAPTVDAAIRTAEAATGSAAVDRIGNLLAPQPAENVDAGPTPDIRPDAAATAGGGSDLAAGGVEPGGGLPAEPRATSAAAPRAAVEEGGAVPPAAPAETGTVRFELNPTGTLTAFGDPKGLGKILRDAGVTSLVSSKAGILVGRSQAQQAQRVLSDFSPQQRNPVFGGGPEANVANPPERMPAEFAQAVTRGEKLTAPADVQFYQNNAKAIEAELRRIRQGNEAPAAQSQAPVDGEPAAQWTGRRGDGYLTSQDAQTALPSRERMHPELEWKVEQMPSGRFRLAGYGTLAAQPKPTTAAPEKSVLRAFLRGAGVAPDLAADITGDRGFRAHAIMPRTFRKGGLQLDELAAAAHEQGFLTDTDMEDPVMAARKLVDMIQAELRGERQAPAQDLEAGAAAELERRRQEFEAEARSLELTPEELADTGYDDAAPEVRARVRELVQAARARVDDLLAKAEQAGVDTESVLENVAKVTENESEHDYLLALEEHLDDAVSRAGEASARDRGPNPRQASQEAQRGAQAGHASAERADVDLLGEAPNASQQAAFRERGQRAERERAQQAKAPDAAEFELGMQDQKKAGGDEVSPKQGPLFSRKAGDERDLLVQHNITAENLLHVDRMGGLAVPSLAITKAAHPLENFGEITLLGDRDMATPSRDTKVFGADAYSPRYPEITYKLTEANWKALAEKLKPHRQDGDEAARFNDYGGGMLDQLTSHKPFQRYAAEQLGGKDPQRVGYHELRSVASQLLSEIGAKEQMFQGFTNMGNRRYVEHTLERVVKILKKDLRGGENFNYGAGSLRAKFTPQFRTLSAIRASKGRLMTKENFEKLRDEINTELLTLAHEVFPDDGFRADDRFQGLVEDAAKMGLDRAAKEYDVELGDTDKQRIRDFMAKLYHLPTEYFEAKVLRAMDLGEFKAAVIPKGLSEKARAILERSGLKVYEYDKDTGDRAAVVRKVAEETPNALFSRGADQAVGLTRASFHSAVAEAFGSKVAEQLEAKGIAIPLEDQSKLPRHVVPFVRSGDTVYGFYDPNTDRTYAVLSNLSPGMVKGLVLHEVGVHYGFKRMLGEEKYATAMRQLDLLRRAKNEAVLRARELAVENSDNASQVPEETLAYLVQSHPEMGIVRSVIAAVKAFLFREFGIGGKFLTVDDLSALARAAVAHAATQSGATSRASAQVAAQFQRVFHGSPHDFDTFSSDAIGTGEGAQVYGHGLYFAGKKEVAEHYRRNLTGADGKPVRWDNTSLIPRANGGTLGQRIESLERLVQRARDDVATETDEQRRKWAEGRLKNALAELEDAKKQGRVYEVEIPDEGEYLLWDKPLSEQPQAVKDALKKGNERYGETGVFFGAAATDTGEQIYRGIQKMVGGQPAASQWLHEAGIRGIKYLDGDSRNRALREVKQEFLAELPEDATFDDVTDLIGSGTFKPEHETILTALKDNDWLGFDYPAQAISAALGGHLANYDASPELVKAVSDSQEGGTHNYVLFDDADASIAAKFSRAPAGTSPTASSPAQSPWRDPTGRLQFAPGAWLYEKLGKASAPLLTKIGMKAADPKLRRILREMKVDVQKAQDTAAAVAKEAMHLPQAEREMVSDLIEQEVRADVAPPEHAVRLAAMIGDSLRAQTEELVRLGMLTRETADFWRDRYLARYYKSKLALPTGNAWADKLRPLLGMPKSMRGIKGQHLKGRGLYQTVPEGELAHWEAMGWQVRDPDYQPGLTGDGTVQVWRDFSREERERMGEIRDAGFRFVMGYMETQRDIALGRMFERIAADPEMSGRHETEEFSVQVPDGTVPGTGAKRYGKLAGRWVSADTLSHLSQFEEMHNATWRAYRKALAIWKEGKTSLNPVAHVNNMVSNLTMAHFAGVNYWDAPKYISAARDFATKSDAVKEARDAGLFLGTLSDSELLNVLPEDLKALVRAQESTAAKIGRTGLDVMTFWLRRPMGWAYQAEDTFFRYLIFKDARARGMGKQDAVDYAQKFIFSYDDLPKTARIIRDFGIPFFSYTYKAAPALLQTALTHPLRFAAPAAVLWAANAAAYAIAAGDDDDSWDDRLKKYLADPEHRAQVREKEKLEREHLPEWMKGSSYVMGTPKTIRLGTDEITKLPVFIDTSRLVPGGDLFDMNPNGGGIPWFQPLTPNNPLLTTYMAMFGNKDAWLGKDLVDSNDTRGEATEKRLAWLWKQVSPAIAVGNYHWERGMQALAQASGGEVKWLPEWLSEQYTGIGRDGNPVQPAYAAMQTFGIKARPIDLDSAEAIDHNLRNKMVRDIEIEMSKIRRLNQKGAISDGVADKALDLQREKQDRLRDGLTVDGDKKD